VAGAKMPDMARWPGGLCASVTAMVLLACCSSGPSGSGDADELAGRDVPADITVTSPAFDEDEPIPQTYSCDGDDHSPALAWQGVPDPADELALVVDDPDASGGTYVHWVLFGLDPSVTALDEGTVPSGARQATNSAGDARYKGPCPPGGDDAHRYRFTLYALDDHLGADDGADLGDVLPAIGRAAIAKGTLTGTFDR
jgi:Raf kinase inhibitor-like YbhB/YbcL family protein